ncbi:protein of unknown function [Lactiplantibacillus plantarum]
MPGSLSVLIKRDHNQHSVTITYISIITDTSQFLSFFFVFFCRLLFKHLLNV